MNRARADLNLFYVVHAVIAESGVSRAARRLAMTQPAVSNALRRARELMQDEILVKGPSGLRPTAFALSIWPDLDEALGRITQLTRIQEFDPADTRLNFRVAITASLEGDIAPRLARRIAAEAPHAKLSFQPHTDPRSTADLEQGRLDCAVGMFPAPPESLNSRGLLHDEHVCVMHKDHPAPTPLTLESFIRYRHVLVSPSARASGLVDSWLGVHGRTRDVAVVVNRYEEALAIAAVTDMITEIPRHYALAHVGAWARLEPLPFESQQVLYKLLWHDRTDRSPAQSWLRELVVACLQHAKEENPALDRGSAPD